MASIIKRNKTLYIIWYDPFEKKRKQKSTGLVDNQENKKIAKVLANKLQKQIDKMNDQSKKGEFETDSLEKAQIHFLEINKDKHSKTILDYHRFFNYFFKSYNKEESCRIITKRSIEKWLMEIKKLPLAQNSIHGLGKQLSHFLNFLFEYEYVSVFKINRNVKTKPEVKEKIIFNEEEIRNIFSNLDDKTENFKTLIYLAFYTGLRSSDMLSLKVENIDLENRIIRYYSPKRKTDREIPFHNDLLPILTQRKEELQSGKLLDYSTVETMGRAVSRYIKNIGLGNKGYSARTFRKTFISRARYSDMDPSVVAELVGHVPNTTGDKYYNRVSIKKMKKELKKYKRPN